MDEVNGILELGALVEIADVVSQVWVILDASFVTLEMAYEAMNHHFRKYTFRIPTSDFKGSFRMSA